MTQLDEGRVAIVTGAAKGMGVGIAEVLTRAGARVFITDLDAAIGELTAKKLSNNATVPVEFIHHDVTSQDSCRQLAQQVVERAGRIDILVNNAGVSRRVPFLELDEAEWDRVFDVCSKGVFLTSAAVAPIMVGQKYGRIIHIASLVSKTGFPNFAHYSAAKASLLTLGHAMAIELAPFGITVNSVMPGVVRTPLWDEGLLPSMVDADTAGSIEEAWEQALSPIPMGRAQTPEDIGEAVAFLASEAARNITGEALNVTGGQLIN